MGVIAAVLDWTWHVVSTLSLVDAISISAAMLLIRLCRYAGMWMYALIALPGTLAHELAHFVVAFVLGA